MKSIRLNAYLRKQIQDSIIKEFSDNFFESKRWDNIVQMDKEADQMLDEILLGLWIKLYGHYSLELVPLWSLKQKNPFGVMVKEDSSKYASRRIPWNDSTNDTRPCKAGVDLVLSRTEWNKVFGKYETLKRKMEEHYTKRNELQSEIGPLLDSFGSTKQLVHSWPSVKKYIPASVLDPEVGAKLPAICIKKLEDKINGE